MISLGVLGAALLYGDGAITPAISVLSALEGLKTPVPAIAPYIVALSALILVGLFALQPQGSERIGKLFGPIMALWFLNIGVLGLGGIMKHPGVLVALIRATGLIICWGTNYGFSCPGRRFPLRYRGGSALRRYRAFRRRPIRFAWYGLVFPCLVSTTRAKPRSWSMAAPGLINSFCFAPPSWQLPLVVLATVADHHRQPVEHRRRLFHDPAGDPARVVPAPAYRADLGRRLRPDLYWLRQLVIDGR